MMIGFVSFLIREKCFKASVMLSSLIKIKLKKKRQMDQCHSLILSVSLTVKS